MSTQHLLVELGTEELPPKALRRLSQAFAANIASGLAEHSLAHDRVEAYATPRRLAVSVPALSTRQPDRDVEMRGPPVKVAFADDGTPTRAAEAFAKKCGIAVDRLERLETDKGTWLVHRATETGQTAATLVPAIVTSALEQLPIPKRMRWGDREDEFVRPAHWLVLLLDDTVVEASILGLNSDRQTRGHRFHAPAALSLAHASDYVARLREDGHVVADFDQRRKQIVAAVTAAATDAGGEPVSSDSLYDEVTALVEWPVPVLAGFADEYLALPDEVLIETLQSHQRYFPVRDQDGQLLPRFVTVSNIDSKEPDQVREGNERVVRPRLADAAFFYHADRSRPLAARIEALDAVVFQKELGSLGDKTRRVQAIAQWLATHIDADVELAGRAALLAKCDLLTDMVGEFPSLQGTMGRYYADHDSEAEAVCQAIEQQYWPRHAGDRLPDNGVAQALAIADRIDTIVGIFAIGKRPTGTRDPFALRRSALGVLRMLIECRLDVDLAQLIAVAAQLQPVAAGDDVRREVLQYFLDRLRGYYVDDATAAVTPQVFDAVVATTPTVPVDFDARIAAVKEFAGLEAADALAAANKRIANILRAAESRPAAAVDPQQLSDAAEVALYDALQSVAGEAEAALVRRDYVAVLTALASLRPAIDRFFDDVMVMSENPDERANRLALLQQLRSMFLGVADVSRLQVG